jgi:hypothetical protein
LREIDLTSHTASGTLTWDGTDGYWTLRPHDPPDPTIDTVPASFSAHQTIQLGASNTVLSLETCPRAVRLRIDGFANSSYGPFFAVKVTPDFAVVDGIDASSYAVGAPYASITNTGFGTSSFGTTIGNVTGKQETLYLSRDDFGDVTSWGGHLVGPCHPSSSTVAQAQLGGPGLRRRPWTSYESRKHPAQQLSERRGRLGDLIAPKRR